MDARERRKQNEQERKRQDILQVSERIFADRGFHGTKMEDLAAACGHAVGALYKYFKSKDAIYEQLIQIKLDQLFQMVKESLSGAANGGDAINATVQSSFRFFEENRDFFRIYVNEVKGFQWNLKANVGRSVFARYQDFLVLVQTVVERAIEAGEFRRDIQSMSYAVAIVGTINAFFTQWLSRPADCAWKLDADEVARILLEGMRQSPRGGVA